LRISLLVFPFPNIFNERFFCLATFILYFVPYFRFYLLRSILNIWYSNKSILFPCLPGFRFRKPLVANGVAKLRRVFKSPKEIFIFFRLIPIQSIIRTLPFLAAAKVYKLFNSPRNIQSILKLLFPKILILKKTYRTQTTYKAIMLFRLAAAKIEFISPSPNPIKHFLKKVSIIQFAFLKIKMLQKKSNVKLMQRPD